ncbi:hypothetical protein MKW98_019590, partial [Papaver atlanticum]
GWFIIKIKGPEEWSWDPEKVLVVIDQDGCMLTQILISRSRDGIHFWVGSHCLEKLMELLCDSCNVKDKGPSNIKVELLSQTDDLVSCGQLLARKYHSRLILLSCAWKYKLRASHPNPKVEVKRFLRGSVPSFFHGRVVQFLEDVYKIKKFPFNSIPCGVYEILPYGVDGVGVDGVMIILDGQERATTDAQGHYKLDQVTFKHYKMVLPNLASVADVKATYYDIFGVVQMVNSGKEQRLQQASTSLIAIAAGQLGSFRRLSVNLLPTTMKINGAGAEFYWRRNSSFSANGNSLNLSL